MKINFLKKGIVCNIIIFLILICLMPSITGHHLEKEIKKEKEIIESTSLWKYVDITFYGVTLNLGVPPWEFLNILFPGEIPILPGFPYVYYTAISSDSSSEDGAVAHIRVTTLNGEVIQDEVFYESCMLNLICFIGSNPLYPIIDFNGGNIHGIAMLAFMQ